MYDPPVPPDAVRSRSFTSGADFPPLSTRDLYGTVSGRLYPTSRRDALQILQEAERLSSKFNAKQRVETLNSHVLSSLPVRDKNGGGSPHNSQGHSMLLKIRALVYVALGIDLFFTAVTLVAGRALGLGLLLMAVSVGFVLRGNALSKRWG